MGNGQGSMGESRGYLVLRLYIHMEGRRCIVVVVVVALSSSSSSLSLSLSLTLVDSPLVHSSLFLPLSSPGSRERFLARARFSRSPWVGSIATSADSASFFQYIPTRIPDPLGHERGEPDLSPLNGINKLYYACTSP